MAIKSDIMAAALRKSSTPLAHSNSGNGNLRPETLGVTRREGSPERANPTAETGSPRTGYGNVALFPTHGNHVDLRGFQPLTSAVQAPARLTGSSLRSSSSGVGNHVGTRGLPGGARSLAKPVCGGRRGKSEVFTAHPKSHIKVI